MITALLLNYDKIDKDERKQRSREVKQEIRVRKEAE